MPILDDAVIIYLALCNQLLVTTEALGDLKKELASDDENVALLENLNMTQYIHQRTEELVTEYELKVQETETTIKRPQW